MKHAVIQIAAVLAAALCAVPPCPAGTVNLAQDMQVADLKLEDLGFDPNAFFFLTANTAYDFNGIYEVEIIASSLNPAGANSLDGATAQQITLGIDSTGNVISMSGINAPSPSPTVPEPASVALLSASVIVVLLGGRFRKRPLY
jgi:hypothetical protein